MRLRTHHTPLAAMAILVSVLTLPGVAQAQQPAKSLVALKATATAIAENFVIPMEPMVIAARITGTAQDNLLGQTQVIQHAMLRLNADGTPLSFTDGIYVWTAANGDAIMGTFTAHIRPSSKPGMVDFEGRWYVTGGKGRFVGATGGGVASGSTDLATQKSTLTLDGLISPPKS